ncbi:unnamed protein product [Fraxinus pennsylvanica]|uniref:Sugar transporter n=1 Tax=Fraxinus pennsylvanica TaxID=56036 RepID=A0AAD1ZF39_9LAMI|nr:unnamed protein product [Fraxinus pennsylvanica]
MSDSAPKQVDDILSELSHLREEQEATIAEMFQGKCLKALIIGAGLGLFQQITGQSSVLYYAATIFQSAGFSAASDATKVSILLGLLKLIMTGVAVLVVDRLGRRPLLLGGISGMVISLFLLGSYYTYLDDVPAVAVVALLLYVGCYQIDLNQFPKDVTMADNMHHPNKKTNLSSDTRRAIFEMLISERQDGKLQKA